MYLEHSVNLLQYGDVVCVHQRKINDLPIRLRADLTKHTENSFRPGLETFLRELHPVNHLKTLSGEGWNDLRVVLAVAPCGLTPLPGSKEPGTRGISAHFSPNALTRAGYLIMHKASATNTIRQSEKLDAFTLLLLIF